MEYRFTTWRDEQEREMGEMTFFMAGVVMHGIANKLTRMTKLVAINND